MNNTIYMDNHATTPIAPEVLAAMMPYLTTHFGNASSTHPFGIAANPFGRSGQGAPSGR